MSQESIEHIIGKLLLDSAYRDSFLADPDQALSTFVLTSTEKGYLKRMDAETLDQLANWLTTRSSQWEVDNLFRVAPNQKPNP